MERTTNQTIAPRRRSGAGRFFSALFIILLVILVGFCYWKYGFTYSSGERFGLLQKFSYKGNIFKTYEGEMILSSVRSSTNVPLASEKFYFSVDDKSVATQLMTLQGKYVNVYYKQKNGALLWRGDSPYIVDSVKVEQQ